MSLGAEQWFFAMMYAADQFEDGSLVIEDDTLDVLGGGTVNLRVKLGAKPRSSVEVALSESSDLFSLGTDSLTFTPGNWDDYQTVVVTPSGANANRQAIALPAGWYFFASTLNTPQKQWTAPNNQRPAIDASLKPANTTRVLQQLRVTSAQGVGLTIASTQTGSVANDDLTSAFETDGSFSIVAGTNKLTILMNGLDLTEPYIFDPPNSAEISAFYDALPTTNDSQAATLILRDYEAGTATISLSASGTDEYSGVSGSATVTVD